jgi:hypothetical protein
MMIMNNCCPPLGEFEINISQHHENIVLSFLLRRVHPGVKICFKTETDEETKEQ